MFDLTSSKLMILAIVALIVVGPKDFPILLRTIGRYLGVIKRHADDFRAQFDEAIREAELHEMKAEVDKMSREIEASVREADRSIAATAGSAQKSLDEALAETAPSPAAPASTPPTIGTGPAPQPALSHDGLTSGAAHATAHAASTSAPVGTEKSGA